jgi:acyl dehydratase
MAMSNTKLFFLTLRNAFSKGINRELIGYSIEREYGPVLADDLRKYAGATNDDNPAYRAGNPAAPPMFLARIAHPLMMHAVTLGDLKLNVLRMVHGEQTIDWHKPIRAGDRLIARLAIKDVRDTRAGELCELSTQALLDGELACEAIIGLMVRGRSSGNKPKSSEKPAEQRKEIFRLQMQTQPDQALRYAEASGDTNFIHTSEFLARLAGLPRTILHGMCGLAMSCASLTNQLASGDISRLRHIKVRFSSPVFPGDLLTLVGYEGEKPGETLFEVLNPSGKPVIKDGVIRFSQES